MNASSLSVLLLLALAPSLCRARADDGKPTVTREEDGWIREAVTLAQTNAVAAATLLEGRAGPKASAALNFAAGNFHFQAGALEPAAAAYRRALGKQPVFRAARVNLARVELLAERPREALELLRALTAEGAGDADTFLLLGHALLLTDAPLSAETAYRQALMLRPGDPDALLGLARALLPQDRPAESLAVASELLLQRPLQRDLRALRANALMALDRPEEAAAALEAARRLGLADAGMLATLGDLHLNARRPREAVEAYEAAAGTEAPPVARLLRGLEALLQTRQTEAALPLARRLRDLPPGALTGESRRAWLRLEADLALQRGDSAAARGRFEELLAEDPLDGAALLRLAELHLDDGRADEAVMLCERAARLAASRVEALLLHARIEVGRAAYAKAVPLLEAAQIESPSERVGRYLDQIRRLQALAETPPVPKD